MPNVTLKTLMSITELSNRQHLSFTAKLQHIITEVAQCMHTERGSIMLLRGRKTLEVVASTMPCLIGIKQVLLEDSPSSWVVKHKKILYVGPDIDSVLFQKRHAHYKKESFLVAPIMRHTKVIGVMTITDKHGIDAFSDDEREEFLAITGQVIATIEYQRLAETVRKSRAAIVQKNHKLKNLERIRTELFNMLIHDLKGPISEVVANLDILSYTSKGENLEYVQAAQSSCDTLFRMITDLLDITRLEEGSLPLIPENIPTGDLIHEAVIRLTSMAKARGVILEEQVPAALSKILFTGDRGILLRVMQNLLINAVQHSPSGAGVMAGCEHSAQHLTFWVEDHGPGIAPEFQDAVFNKFFQITKKRDGRRYSTGLGLTFCKMAVEAHRGTIHVLSDGQRGSRFIFTLPLKA